MVCKVDCTPPTVFLPLPSCVKPLQGRQTARNFDEWISKIAASRPAECKKRQIWLEAKNYYVQAGCAPARGC